MKTVSLVTLTQMFYELLYGTSCIFFCDLTWCTVDLYICVLCIVERRIKNKASMLYICVESAQITFAKRRKC